MSDRHDKVIAMLTESYCMELETVMNYLALSVNLDGVRAEQIKQALAADVGEEISHAQELGKRIKQLGGALPGSADVSVGHQVQPPSDTTDVVAAIKGVIDAEESARSQYLKTIAASDGSDPVTADLCTRLLADEEEHLVLFRGFLKEYESEMSARRALETRSAAASTH
ncbi:MAG: rubrerythrin [Planctomycetota bacterium]|nr:MAG: rubrerythrin [Planctomycetota bacterium]